MSLTGPLRRARTLTVTALAVTAGASCAAAPSDAQEAGRLQVLASFYPLEYVVEAVGGRNVSVEGLTPPRAEPHDVELSPRQVRTVGEAGAVVYQGGFQPAVENAVAARRPRYALDVAATPALAGRLTTDPHFWLDPTLLASIAPEVAATLSAADPARAAEYAAGAERLAADLTALDEAYAEGLATCERRVIVSSHTSFGFLADRYGLEQVGLSGIDPEAEPSPARLREVRAVVQETGTTTLFTEELVSPKVAETLAADLGITTAVLDPIESPVPGSADYRDAMEQNLTVLRAALGCS